MTDDLSTRLLAAITTAEKEAAKALADEHAEWSGVADSNDDKVRCMECGWSRPGSWNDLEDALCAHVRAEHPDPGLRLCQAHREIVGQFQRAWDQRNTGNERERLIRQARAIALIDVLQALSRGYGLDTPREGKR